MGFYTPAGEELSTAVWAALDVADLKGLDAEKTPREPDSFGNGGFRLRGHGDKVEVFYALDEFLVDDLLRHAIASMMLGAITGVLVGAAGRSSRVSALSDALGSVPPGRWSGSDSPSSR